MSEVEKSETFEENSEKPTEVIEANEEQAEKDDTQAESYVNVIRDGKMELDDNYIDQTLLYANEKGGESTASALADCVTRGKLPDSEFGRALSTIQEKGGEQAMESISFAIANGRLTGPELDSAWSMLFEKGGIGVADNLVQNLNILRGNNLMKSILFVSEKGTKQSMNNMTERISAGILVDPELSQWALGLIDKLSNTEAPTENSTTEQDSKPQEYNDAVNAKAEAEFIMKNYEENKEMYYSLPKEQYDIHFQKYLAAFQRKQIAQRIINSYNDRKAA